MKQLTITVCPICGSRKIRQVRRDVESRRGGVTFTARGIDIEECPHCGEQLFSPEALRQIDAQRPFRKKRGGQRKSA
jgi:YgiT-type zinc finger domain-containing protein